MANHVIKPLTLETYDAFAELVEKHNGVWGGCWCSWFHDDSPEHSKKMEGREYKRHMVEAGIAHAALVFDGEQAIGWAEYGTPEELPHIYHRKQYVAEEVVPGEYRITCFFVDRDHRKQGVASEALDGALSLIAGLGGGVVESFPQDVGSGQKITSSFLFNGIRPMFERAGFEYVRPLGTKRCVMRKTV